MGCSARICDHVATRLCLDAVSGQGPFLTISWAICENALRELVAGPRSSFVRHGRSRVSGHASCTPVGDQRHVGGMRPPGVETAYSWRFYRHSRCGVASREFYVYDRRPSRERARHLVVGARSGLQTVHTTALCCTSAVGNLAERGRLLSHPCGATALAQDLSSGRACMLPTGIHV